MKKTKNAGNRLSYAPQINRICDDYTRRLNVLTENFEISPNYLMQFFNFKGVASIVFVNRISAFFYVFNFWFRSI